MGIVASRYLGAEGEELIQNETGFSQYRINYLLGQYQSLERDAEGQVLRSELLKVPPVANHPLAERLVDVYLHPSKDFRHFIQGLSRFRRRAPLQLKLQSVFQMYNTNINYNSDGDCDGDGDDKDLNLISVDQCTQLINQMPATHHEMRAMHWKLKMLSNHYHEQQELEDKKDVHEEQQQNQKGCINCEDLAYIIRGIDLHESFSLRFN